eukprot:scaffold206118_cov35-Tisochrysis_lutea.AAC.2
MQQPIDEVLGVSRQLWRRREIKITGDDAVIQHLEMGENNYVLVRCDHGAVRLRHSSGERTYRPPGERTYRAAPSPS